MASIASCRPFPDGETFGPQVMAERMGHSMLAARSTISVSTSLVRHCRSRAELAGHTQFYAYQAYHRR